MFKGLRWPFLALVVASGLLIVAVVTRPDDAASPGAAPDPTATVTPVPPTPDPTPTPQPVAQAPAPLPADSPANLPPTVLVEALIGRISKLNPLLATYNPVDQDITSLIFEGLTTTNAYGEIVPALAESWTVSQDGLEYVVVLHNDVLWQDGVPFTAQDVVFTVQLLSDPLFPGAAALSEFWRTVEVDALGASLVRFRLTQPLASFPDQLRIGIVPYHVLQGAPVDKLGQHPFNLDPIGTGPYQLETLTASNGQIDGVQLRAAPVYRQRPEGEDGYQLDRIVFRTYPTAAAALDAYRQGEVNSISAIPPDQVPAAAQLPGLSLYTAVEPVVGVLIYNWDHESMNFVRNPRARLGLAHALDRAGMVTEYLSGRAILADSPLLPGSWAYEPGLAWPDYNLDKARSMLETAGLSSGEQAPPVENESAPEPEVTETQNPDAAESPTATPQPLAPSQIVMSILTLDDPALVAIANAIAADWRQLRFIVTVEAVDAPTLRERLEAGSFDAALIELSFAPSADPDPYVFWHTGQNYGGMNDRRISEALEQARRDPFGVNRIVYYRRFQELFAERVPALVLFYPLYVYAADARLQGVQIGFLSTHSDRFRTIRDWHFAG